MTDREASETAVINEDGERNLGRRASMERSARVVDLARVAQDKTHSAAVVTFDRHELREIFGIYGRMVAEGEWRDYAVDFGRERAVFSVYRRASEVPLYRIEKNPKLARRQGEYAVVAASGLILRRGHDLKRVVSVLEKPVKLVVS